MPSWKHECGCSGILDDCDLQSFDSNTKLLWQGEHITFGIFHVNFLTQTYLYLCINLPKHLILFQYKSCIAHEFAKETPFSLFPQQQTSSTQLLWSSTTVVCFLSVPCPCLLLTDTSVTVGPDVIYSLTLSPSPPPISSNSLIHSSFPSPSQIQTIRIFKASIILLLSLSLNYEKKDF